jgi:hypothetical protein
MCTQKLRMVYFKNEGFKHPTHVAFALDLVILNH